MSTSLVLDQRTLCELKVKAYGPRELATEPALRVTIFFYDIFISIQVIFLVLTISLKKVKASQIWSVQMGHNGQENII